MISIVCVYNNKQILDNYLLKSLKNQTAEFELITLDNTQSKFKSAAEALNYGGKKAKGKYIMFVHQDVDSFSISWLEKVEKVLDKIPNLGIAGVAGKKDETGMITNIKHDNPPRLAGKIQIKIPEEVQTLDECLIMIPQSVFNMLHFDEIVCDNWHLYAVDYCLSVKKLGYNAYVIPMFVHHGSPGSPMSKEYYSTLGKLLKKHKQHYDRIYTTTGNWSAFYPLRVWVGTILQKLGIKRQVKTLLEKSKVLKK